MKYFTNTRTIAGGPLTAINVIAYSALLHNICEDQGIRVNLEDDGVDNGDELDRNDNLDRDGQQIRRMLIREKF
jgi:hypothetical protein